LPIIKHNTGSADFKHLFKSCVTANSAALLRAGCCDFARHIEELDGT